MRGRGGWGGGGVDEGSCEGKETVLMVRCFGPDGPQPLAGEECHKEFVSRMGGVRYNLTCTPQGPRGVQVLHGWQVAADHPLSRANDSPQSVPVSGSGSSTPGGDGGGEDGLDDGSVEVHHHRPWRVEFVQLPQEVHPLLGFF